MTSILLLLLATLAAPSVGSHIAAQQTDIDAFAKSLGFEDDTVLESDKEQLVTLPDGTILKGVHRGNVVAFKGVRYAEPPLGQLRWAPPQPWQNPDTSVVYDASKFGSACKQGITAKASWGNEDCLYLHLWVSADHFANQTAASSTPPSLPVGLFIHGGSYNTGSGSMYSGQALVDYWRGAGIVVTVNYRLNVFGFLGSEELRQQDAAGGGSTGNYGLQDQRMAMQWVQRNIAAFGGDSGKVMIFGESAGAGSVANHLAMPRSWEFFTSAGMESGAFAEWVTQPMSVSEASYQSLLQKTACADLACMLAMDTETIYAHSWEVPKTADQYLYPYSPTADGVEIQTHPWIALAEGKVADVPVLLGTNADDGGTFVPLRKNATDAELWGYWERKGYDSADKKTLAKMYMGQEYPEVDGVSQQWWAGSRSEVDSFFSCASKYGAQQLAAQTAAGSRRGDTFLYVFQHPRANERFVTHFSEVPFVFRWEYVGFHTAEDRDMADVMSSYWGNFIVSADPSSGAVGLKDGLPAQWVPFTSSHEVTLLLPTKEDTVVAEDGVKNDECAFFIPKLDSAIRAAFAASR